MDLGGRAFCSEINPSLVNIRILIRITLDKSDWILSAIH